MVVKVNETLERRSGERIDSLRSNFVYTLPLTRLVL